MIPLQGGAIIPELGGGFLRNQHLRAENSEGRGARPRHPPQSDVSARPGTCGGHASPGYVLLTNYQRLLKPPPPTPVINLRIMSRTIAPSVALTTRATMPVPRWIPSRGSSRSPMKAPITPTIRSPMRP
jgi:hypothetical protein